MMTMKRPMDIAGAVICTFLAMVYFAVGFAAGESPEPESVGVRVFLWMVPLAAVAVGVALALISRSFPWLTALLTPAFVGMFFASMMGFQGFVIGFKFGGIASGLFLVGAFGVFATKRWINTRRRSH